MTKEETLKFFDDDNNYYADNKFMTNSALKLIRQSPTKYYLQQKGKWSYPTTPAFDIGSALHALFLEGKHIAVRFEGTRRGNEYKEFKAANEGKIVMPAKDYDTVYAMHDKLSKLSEVEDLMTIDFRAEVPMIMNHVTERGNIIPVKGKADAVVFNGVDTYLVDLKTYGKTLDEFERSAKFMLYNQQAYIYKTLFGVDDFYFLVQEKVFPYEVGIYKASDKFLYWGGEEFKKSIDKYEQLFLNGNFNPYSATIGEL